MLKVLVVVVLFMGANFALAQGPSPLTKGQIEELIAVLPDKALAREIRQRGTDFRVDRPILDHFKDKEAGIETVKALSELLPNASLVITSVPPDCDVSMGGHLVGSTDDAGNLIVSDLDAGRSVIQISKQGYRNQSFEIDLSHGKTSEVFAKLDRLVGFLSISANPPNANVAVHTKDNHDAACTPSPTQNDVWECAPGEYVVRATRERLGSATQNVRVTDGETTSVSINLILEPAGKSAPESMNEGPAFRPSPLDRPSGTRNAKDLDSIRLLALVQNAMGGRDKLATVRDWQQRAKETWEPSRGTTDLTTIFVAPSSVREEARGGNRTVNYSNGLTGWTWSSSRPGTRDLPHATATGMAFRTLTTLVLSDDDPERSVRIVPPGTIAFSDKYHNSATLIVDPNSHLPLKLSWTNLDGAILEETYSDWRRIGDVMWWFHMTRARNGNVFLEVRVNDYRINTGLADQQMNVQPDRMAQRPPDRPVLPADGKAEFKTDGDRRGTLVLFSDHIEYRDDGMGTGGGRAPYGPNPSNNFFLSCSEITSIKAYGFRPILFGSFEIVISARRHKFHIPAVKSEPIAKAIRDRCGVNSGGDH